MAIELSGCFNIPLQITHIIRIAQENVGIAPWGIDLVGYLHKFILVRKLM